MKYLKRDLRGLSRQIAALGKKIDKSIKRLDVVEKESVSGQRAVNAGLSAIKETTPKKRATGKKRPPLTATDQIVHMVNQTKHGADIPTLVKKSGFNEGKIRNIVARACKEGRITRVGRGIYGACNERRKHSRIHSLNLVSYACIDENNRLVRQAMGRTLDITEGGMLLETHVPMNPQHSVSLTMGVKEDLVHVQAKVIHCQRNKQGKYQSGLQFTGMDQTSLRILKRFIAAFRKHQSRA